MAWNNDHIGTLFACKLMFKSRQMELTNFG